MFLNGKIGYWLSYEIDYVYRFDEDVEKDFFFLDWCVVDDEDHEEEDGRRGRRWIIQTLTFFLIFLTEGTKISNGDKDKVLKRSFI